ncbi:FKBP-type peptidyl-prolyl cis-trans isomerase [Actinoplanes ianthinogenes]|uniref:FKBP-type peptidyl-prolyl cis-trans isomerase n=1 Tax=Actinoplanes ianthinogenes TaxID=122358 RepID=UPI001E355885|nr:FKBP-type peptidyl-prolyl cis-trans isomerase [Actinoplanes ianthinogenes]
MPDSVTSRSAADKRAAARPPRNSAGGPPLKTKADKRAEAKAAKARARARQKRREMLTMAGAAAVVLALVVGLFVWINSSSEPTSVATSPTATATTDAAAAPTESAAAFPPVPAGADPALSKKPVVKAGTGSVTKLKTTTLIKGTGPAVRSGQTVDVNYVGVTYADGKEFDSSWSRSQPFSFQVGAGRVIPGWDKGLLGVEVGSRVQLDIPAAMAYGEKASPPQPAGTLRFVVDVLAAS